MGRKQLSDEQIEEIANREWKQQERIIEDKAMPKRFKNLKGPQTVEGKKKALQNLHAGSNKKSGGNPRTHGGYVHKILNEDELELYNARREAYEDDYDINSSADEIVLHTVLMEEVKRYRLSKFEYHNPNVDIEKAIDSCDKRLMSALNNLGALRKQRLKQDENMHALSIATVAQQFARELNSGSIQKELEQARLEEEEFRKTRKKDINDDYITVKEEDIEVIDDE